jgi:hypothetical protein
MNLKEALAQQENQNASDSDSVVSENQPSEESVNIESQATETDSGFSSLLKRATNNLKTTLTETDSPSRKKNVAKTTRDDFSILVVSVITLLVSFWKIEEQAKPDSTEINMLSHHLSGIMLRHLPINNKLSADALDVIGIFAVMANWQARVRVLQPQDETQQAGPTQAVTKRNGHKAQTPIQMIDPATSNMLDMVKSQAANRSGS